MPSFNISYCSFPKKEKEKEKKTLTYYYHIQSFVQRSAIISLFTYWNHSSWMIVCRAVINWKCNWIVNLWRNHFKRSTQRWTDENKNSTIWKSKKIEIKLIFDRQKHSKATQRSLFIYLMEIHIVLSYLSNVIAIQIFGSSGYDFVVFLWFVICSFYHCFMRRFSSFRRIKHLQQVVMMINR